MTPFAPRARDRGLTALLVGLIRLLGDTFNANEGAGEMTVDHPYVQETIEYVAQRAGYIQDKELENVVRAELKKRLDRWIQLKNKAEEGANLGYTAKDKTGQTVGLLQVAGESKWSDFTCLTSLRDVEPTINLILGNELDAMTQQYPVHPMPVKSEEVEA